MAIPLDGPVLNPVAERRTEGADRLGVELVETALSLPAPGAVTRMAKLTAGLHSLDPITLAGEDMRTAFWLNVHNALMLHALHATRDRGRRFFTRAAYAMGGRRWSLAIIEHALFRGNARVRFFRVLRKGDPRLDATPGDPDPRTHFALHRGGSAAPDVQAYLSGTVGRQLDRAGAAYFATHASADLASGTITLPGLMRTFRADFGTKEETLRLAAKNFGGEIGAWIAANPLQARIRYSPYDERLRRPAEATVGV